MRAFWTFVILSSSIIGWFGADSAHVSKPYQIADVSWPNCDVYVTPADQGIVGVTGGLAFRPNPCLASEAVNFKHPSLYINTGYPGTKIGRNKQISPKACRSNDKQCLAYNYGYNSGRFAIDYSLKSGVLAKRWWLDVETENSWDKNPHVNRAALRGAYDAIAKFAGQDNVGFYSYPGQWDLLTNKWRNGNSAWVATGSTELADAQDACQQLSFTGGPILLAQYTPDLDQSVKCKAYF